MIPTFRKSAFGKVGEKLLILATNVRKTRNSRNSLGDKVEMAKMTSKGQLTLPKAVRTKMKLNEGDNVVFMEKGDGYIILNEKIIEERELNLDSGEEKGSIY